MNAAVAEIRRLEAQVAAGRATAVDWVRLAELRLHARDLEGAVAGYRAGIAAGAANPSVYNNLGVVLLKSGRAAEALVELEQALALDPGYLRAQVNSGKALRETGRTREAILRLRAALDTRPDYAPALVNLGDALAAEGELGEAATAFERALRVAPGSSEALQGLGLVRLQSGQLAQALSALRAAVASAPDNADAHSNLAHALFVSGDWRSAWPHFEYRFGRSAHRGALPKPPAAQRWDGTLRADREVWLLGEQGLGDQLQFARYAKLLAASGQPCALACAAPLVGLLSAAELGARVVALDASMTTEPGSWYPLMSLPLWHRTEPDGVPFADRYLRADPERVARWRARLASSGGLRVALAWAGNPRMETGRYVGRSPPLAAFAPLLTVANASFVSLQKGPGSEQLAAVPFAASIANFADLDAGPHAFMDTAAALECLDLLVTSDSAIAHLGGALGIPTWLCLVKEPDWRWMRDGPQTPWYRSLRLYRQRRGGDWAGVFGDVADDLRAAAAAR